MAYSLTDPPAEGSAPVAHLQLDDGKANALNDGLVDALADATARVAADGAGALVIRGRPGVFSGDVARDSIDVFDPRGGGIGPNRADIDNRLQRNGIPQLCLQMFLNA